MISHDSASKDCKRKLAEAYALNQQLNGQLSEADLVNLKRKLEQDQDQEPKSRPRGQRKLMT